MKYYNIYVGQGYFNNQKYKDMEERGISIESITYPKIDKKMRIHGAELNCVIEQKGKILYSEDAKKKYWEYRIEEMAPNIKPSFFGLGAYKNVTITGISRRGVESVLSLSAKSANGITCNYSGRVSVILNTLDITKFRKWMKEWGPKFGLMKKGNVWLTDSELQKFVMKVVTPYMFETIVKNKTISASGSTVTYSGRDPILEEVNAAIKTYLYDNLGLTVAVFIF